MNRWAIFVRPLCGLGLMTHAILGLAPQALCFHALRAFSIFKGRNTSYFTTAEKTSSINNGRRQPLDEVSCFRLSVQIGYDAPLNEVSPS